VDRRFKIIGSWLFCFLLISSTGLTATRHKPIFAVTEDGYRIALHRFSSTTDVPASKYPILICHGITTNVWSFDVDPNRSLPRYLADRGFDVYVMELRGHGSSSNKPMNRGIKKKGWDLTDYAELDLPAAMQLVFRQTGTSRLHYIGHSMGGIVALIHSSIHPNPPFASLTLISSPVRLRLVSDYPRMLLNYEIFHRMTSFNVGILAKTSLLMPPEPLEMIYATLYNTDSIDLKTGRKFLWRGVGSIAGDEGRQFVSIDRNNRLCDRSGAHSYTSNLWGLPCPVLVISGKLDELAPMGDVAAVLDYLGPGDRTHINFGRADGYKVDYGHMDYLFGKYAPVEVFPAITEWIKERDL